MRAINLVGIGRFIVVILVTVCSTSCSTTHTKHFNPETASLETLIAKAKEKSYPAIRELGHRGGPQVEATLLELLSSDKTCRQIRQVGPDQQQYIWYEFPVRRAAAKSLAAMHATSAIPPIIKMLKEWPSFSFSGGWLTVLEELSGQDFGFDRQKWISWWGKQR